MKACVLIVLVGLCAAAARAQQSHGYVFFAPGGSTSRGHTEKIIHLGIGGEGILGKGVGLGLEIGAVGPTAAFTDGAVGMFSPNGYFHFARRKTKVDPFVTAGYTLLFRSGHANLFNFGGGFNYWFSRLGFKAEFRDHVQPRRFGDIHYWEIRLGLALH